jgi:glutamate--cysteine ligase
MAGPGLAAAAQDGVRAGPPAQPRIGGAQLCDAVTAFTDRFTNRGRCPADDALTLDLSGAFL